MQPLSMVVATLLAASLGGCGLLSPGTVPPRITAQPPPARGETPSPGNDDTWLLAHLTPDEGSNLVDGVQQPISVQFDVSSKDAAIGEYEIWLTLGSRAERPFQVVGVGHAASETLSGTVTWWWRAHGRSESAEVGLYRVERSASGRSATLTLLQSIRRRYDVLCDANASPFERFLKRLFGSCLQPAAGDAPKGGPAPPGASDRVNPAAGP